MRTMIVGATFLAIGASAAGVGALDNINLTGSDTLEDITRDLLLQCPGATSAGIGYIGGGSSVGENAMGNNTQTVAPMSRFLNPTTAVCAKGGTAEGITIALDGLSIVAGTVNGNACGGGLAFSAKSFAVTDAAGAPVVDCVGCTAGTNTYAISGTRPWQDVLNLIWFGKPHVGTVLDCASPARRSLADNWGNLFQAGCVGSTCTNLKHAFRRADLSGTTDTLVSLLGAPSMPLAQTAAGAVARVIPFCNAYGSPALFGGGSDYLDLDPIRRACEANEQVCSRTGTLGLVQVIDLPANLGNSQNFPTANCGIGKFALMTPASGNSITVCPNGLGKLFNKCFQPYIDNGPNVNAYDPPGTPGGNDEANCVALRSPVQGFQANGMNGRAYNLNVRNSGGGYQRDSLNRFVTHAAFRIHGTQVLAGGGVPCNSAASATAQIGCLVQANPCSIGFAGREAEQQANVMGLSVNGLAPSQANIEALVLTPSTADDYPLSRKLFFNTLNGFEAITGGELELARCMADNAKIGPVAAARGFIPVPGGVQCQDFNQSACAGAPADTSSCTNNPAGFPL